MINHGTRSGLPKKMICLCPKFGSSEAHFYLRLEDDNYNITTLELRNNTTLPGAVASARYAGHPDVMYYSTADCRVLEIPKSVNRDLKV